MVILEYFQSNPKISLKILSMMPLIVSTVKQCKRVMFLDFFVINIIYYNLFEECIFWSMVFDFIINAL